MDFWQAAFLGLVQAITEFLPISSSAHLQFASTALNIGLTPQQLTAFIATIQLGTELAVLLYFLKDITRILKSWFATGFSRKPSADAKLGWFVIIGSIPVVVAGLAFKDFIEGSLRADLKIAGTALIGFGLLMLVADLVGKKTKPIEKLTTTSAIFFGLGQMLAVIPGVSRSGGTITAGLFMGFNRQAAARYSFLLAIPAVLASGLFEFASTYKDLPAGGLLNVAIATLIAFIGGYAVIAGFLKYVSKRSLLPFVAYRVVAGIVFIALAS